ncbi:hypothetical protein CLV90_2276 [Maribacter spongiicola]|uniref:Uncharacterized protein n=1 Tax=Maribacter spongiicola TaxID=1206753 RepID=A0A4R7K2U6_9FLAO|nr:hypothetical protein CLV90_2276 [Maribacter spongiicola]
MRTPAAVDAGSGHTSAITRSCLVLFFKYKVRSIKYKVREMVVGWQVYSISRQFQLAVFSFNSSLRGAFRDVAICSLIARK